MKAFDIPIIGDSKNVPQDDPEFTLNFYAEKVSDEVFTLKPTPGTAFDSQLIISGGGRGLVTVAGRLFGIRGGTFQERVAGAWIVRGTLLSTNHHRVAMIYNLKPDGTGQILIVDDLHGYVFTLASNIFLVLTEADHGFVGGGAQAAFCAGRAFAFKPGTTFFQCSDLYDFTVWRDTATSSEQTLNTPLRAIISNGDLLYLFSSDGFSVWQDQGLPTFPVRQILSGDKIGILAPNSALFIERYAYWLGRTDTGEGVAYRHSGGGQPERITTHPQERIIAGLEEPSDAIGCTYNSLGHVFYGINFRSGNTSLFWDKTTELWHNRAVRDASTGQISLIPWVSTVIYDGSILAIYYQDGRIVRIDDELFTDQGDPILRERILSVTPKEGAWLTYYQSAEIFATAGNTPVGQEPPNIMMRYSGDRGMTWSLEQWQKTGGNHSYGTRTRWVGLGSHFGLCLWFRIVASQLISWRQVRIYAE